MTSVRWFKGWAKSVILVSLALTKMSWSSPGSARALGAFVAVPSVSAAVYAAVHPRKVRAARAAYRYAELLAAVRVVMDLVGDYMARQGMGPGEYPVTQRILAAVGSVPDANDVARWFRKAVEADPHFAEAHYFLGWNLMESGDAAEAARAFTSASLAAPRLRQSRLDAPLNVRALSALGMAFEQQELKAEARRAYEKAIALFPHYHGPYVRLGHIAVSEGRVEEAASLFLEGLRPVHFVPDVPKFPRLDALAKELESARLAALGVARSHTR
jgi:tetratricopeptide (TPR) repeat protein